MGRSGMRSDDASAIVHCQRLSMFPNRQGRSMKSLVTLLSLARLIRLEQHFFSTLFMIVIYIVPFCVRQKCAAIYRRFGCYVNPSWLSFPIEHNLLYPQICKKYI